jgi:PAS domain S-box-containing protein
MNPTQLLSFAEGLLLIGLLLVALLLVLQLRQARARLSLSLLRYNEAVRAGGMSLWEMNLKTGDVQIDPSLWTYLGYEANEEADGLAAMAARIPPDDLARIQAQFQAFVGGQLPRYEVQHRIRHRDGRLLTTLSRGSLHYDAKGRPERALCVCIDVTERARMEAAIAQAERDALSLELERQKVRVLTDVFSDLSHDFRTPLSIINTSVYLMERAPSQEARASRARIVEGQTERLARMLDALFMLVRLDMTPALALELVPVAPLLRELVEANRAVAAARGLVVGLDLSDADDAGDALQVLGHRMELSHALQALIDNALEYTPSGGQITVRALRVPPASGEAETRVALIVQDTGIGIAPDAQEYIFDRLYRVDPARSPETGGVGLGLAIAKRIAELHGGVLTVASAPGEGATFTLMLPVSDASEQGA